MENLVNERFKEIIKSKANSVNEFSKLIGVGQSTLNTQLTSSRGVSLDTIIKTLDAFTDLSSEWLLRGTGNMCLADGLPAMTGRETERELELIAENARLVLQLEEYKVKNIKLEGQKEYLEETINSMRGIAEEAFKKRHA